MKIAIMKEVTALVLRTSSAFHDTHYPGKDTLAYQLRG